MTTLLMFSGGMDSTAGLVHLLTETDDDLHVHHVIIKENRREGLYIAQLEAISKIIPYCKKHYRDFKFTTSTLDYMDIQERFISTWNGVCFILLVLLHQELDIEKVIPVVLSKQDYLNNPPYAVWGHGMAENFLSRVERIKKIALIDIDRKITFDYLFVDISNIEMVRKYISQELFGMTWSCNWPISSDISWRDVKDPVYRRTAILYNNSLPPVECGKCLSCSMKSIMEDTIWVEE